MSIQSNLQKLARHQVAPGLTVVVSDGATTESAAFTAIPDSWKYDAFTAEPATLVIGEGVTHIGNFAFSRDFSDYGLAGSLTIPDSVVTIGNFAFYNCSGLTNLTLGDSVATIGNYAFQRCSGLAGSLTIPDSVTSIGSGAFAYCTSLTSLTIPDSVTTIGNSAFYNCSSLTGSLDLPNSVTSIGSSAFSYCSGLTNVNCHTTRSIMNAAGCLSGTAVTTLHARASDGTWTAGADTIGGKALTVIKDL